MQVRDAKRHAPGRRARCLVLQAQNTLSNMPERNVWQLETVFIALNGCQPSHPSKDCQRPSLEDMGEVYKATSYPVVGSVHHVCSLKAQAIRQNRPLPATVAVTPAVRVPVGRRRPGGVPQWLPPNPLTSARSRLQSVAYRVQGGPRLAGAALLASLWPHASVAAGS